MMSARAVMTKPKITPEVVKTIESALEERKKAGDRRQVEANYKGAERRGGNDRRDKP